LFGITCIDTRGRDTAAWVEGLAPERRRVVAEVPIALGTPSDGDPIASGLSALAAAAAGGGLALYRNTDPLMAEGWTRWWFDHHGIRFRSVTDRDLVDGLRAESGTPTTPTRVLVLPGQTETSLTRGPTSRLLPPAFRSGLGQGPGSAAESVKAWVEAGGHLVTFGASGAWAVKTFELPLRNALVSVEKRISLPGTALRLELGAGRRPHPLPASGHGGARR
jgi:hypothetical protein